MSSKNANNNTEITDVNIESIETQSIENRINDEIFADFAELASNTELLKTNPSTSVTAIEDITMNFNSLLNNNDKTFLPNQLDLNQFVSDYKLMEPTELNFNECCDNMSESKIPSINVEKKGKNNSADINPVYLDFNFNCDVGRPLEIHRTPQHNYPYDYNIPCKSNDDCKYMEFINEHGETVCAKYLDIAAENYLIKSENVEKQLFRNEQLNQFRKKNVHSDYVNYPARQNPIDDNKPMYIIPLENDKCDEKVNRNIDSLYSLINHYNENVTRLKPKYTKKIFKENCLSPEEFVKLKLDIIDSMNIEIPIIKTSSGKHGRKQILKAIAMNDDDLSFYITESAILKESSEPIITINLSNVESNTKFCDNNINEKTQDNNNETEILRSTIQCSKYLIDPDTDQKPNRKAVCNCAQNCHCDDGTNKDNDCDNDSDADFKYYADDKHRKSLKCFGCGKMFITLRSLFIHEKRCDSKSKIDNLIAITDIDLYKVNKTLARKTFNTVTNFEDKLAESKVFVVQNKDKPNASTNVIENIEQNQDDSGIAMDTSSISENSNDSLSKLKYCEICDICDRKFTRQSTFKTHKALHDKLDISTIVTDKNSNRLKLRPRKSKIKPVQLNIHRRSVRQAALKSN